MTRFCHHGREGSGDSLTDTPHASEAGHPGKCLVIQSHFSRLCTVTRCFESVNGAIYSNPHGGKPIFPHIKIFFRYRFHLSYTKLNPHLGAVSAGSVEPDGIGGHLITPLGFSERTEHAHQSKRRFPFCWCWLRELVTEHVHGRGLALLYPLIY